MLLEHPALYTAGTSAAPGRPDRAFAIPGVSHRARRAASPIMGLASASLMSCSTLGAAGRDVRAFVHALKTGSSPPSLSSMSKVNAARGRSASLSARPKIASIGIRVRHWVSCTVSASTSTRTWSMHFAGHRPLRLTSPVTSLAALGIDADMQRVDAALRSAFEETLGRSAPIGSKHPKSRADRSAFLGHGHFGHACIGRSVGATPQHLIDLVGGPENTASTLPSLALRTLPRARAPARLLGPGAVIDALHPPRFSR